VRRDDWGFRRGLMRLEVRKSRCLDCVRYFRQPLPGVQPYQRASESFQQMVYQQHLDGINRSCLAKRKGIGAATVQRHFLRRLQRRARQDHPPVCPQVLGIDEHFFTRKKGHATTFCDLKNHRIYDVTLGRSEAALESYFLTLKGKEQVRVVCMDLVSSRIRPSPFRAFNLARQNANILPHLAAAVFGQRGESEAWRRPTGDAV
jgi:transposase